MRRISGWIAKRTKESGSSILRAAALQLVSKYSTILIGLGTQLVLARLLTPTDYGVLAVMMVFTTFFGMLADFGISGAVVQNQNMDSDDIRSIYAWSLRLALVLGIGFACLSYPISIFYGNTIYHSLGCILSIAVFFSALNMVPNALLMKRKFFLLIGLRQVTVAIACAVISIVLAYFGAGVYALVASSVLSAVMNYLWNIKGAGLRLSWHVNKESIRKIRSFSLNVFGFNFVNYFARNLDNLLIGKFFGTVPLGNYNRAYQLMVYPMSMFTHVVTPVLLPFIAEHQQDKQYIYEKFLSTVKILSLLGIFISTFCFFSAKEMVLILFGGQWAGAVPCFQYLSMSIWSQMICATSGTMFQAIGRADLMFKRGLLTAGTTVSCIVIGVLYCSLEGTAFLVSLSYFNPFFLMIYFLVKKGLEVNPWHFCRQLIPDGKIALSMICLLAFISQWEFSDIVYSLILKLTAALLLYVFLLIKTNQMKYFLMVCPKKWRKFLENRFL